MDQVAGPSSPPAPAWLIRGQASGISRKKAVLALTGMTVAALILACTVAALAVRGFAAGSARRAGSAGRLIVPAPLAAGGLPRHQRVVRDHGAQLAIAAFRQRFAALLDDPAAGYPAGLYDEPGRLDPAVGHPAWVMYLGFNEPSKLADPAAAVTRLMASLGGPADKVRPWQVAAGPAGGTAKCSVAVIGLTQVSVCGWATDSTVGAVISPMRDTGVSELAFLMARMRPDLQPG